MVPAHRREFMQNYQLAGHFARLASLNTTDIYPGSRSVP